MTQDINAALNSISRPPTAQTYIDNVNAASHHAASVNPNTRDVDTINKGIHDSLVGMLSDPKNAPLSPKALADEAVNNAMKDPHVQQAAYDISVSGKHDIFLMGDVSPKIRAGLVDGAKAQVADDIVKLKQQQATGAPEIAGHSSSRQGQPATLIADAGNSAEQSQTAAQPTPSQGASPSGSSKATSASSDGLSDLLGGLEHALSAGLKSFAETVANNPELKNAMAMFTQAAPSIVLAVENVLEHQPSTQVASAQLAERPLGRG